jgi:predicted alpha-1,2-mannosidase
VVVKIGLSYTSLANARLNLETEANTLSFDKARIAAQSQWAQMLDRIHVEGGLKSDRIKFYTGLYHALLGRGLASDINGAYPRNDGGIGQIPCGDDHRPLYNHYNSDAVWGTFWNLTQLWALAYPDYFSEFVRCHLDHYRDCGWLPDSIASAKFVSGVGTDYMGLVVASAYLRGIRDFDPEIALQAALKNELSWQGRPLGVGKADLQAFLKLGYSPLLKSVPGFSGSTAEGSQFSVSHTLEYSFSAYAVSQLAETLDHSQEARQLRQLSSAWQQLWDSSSSFVRPKDANGNFLEDFNPRKPWLGYQEGNAWQYTFYVPHDPASLIQRLGQETFNSRLEDVFNQAEQTLFGGGRTVDAFAGVDNVYNHGNQPSLHIAWLFNYSGQPWRTQYYGTERLHGYGFGQDEDQGQLGAWFVLAAIGLFDVQGLTDTHATMQLATPLFDNIRIQLHPKYYPGGSFSITTQGQGNTPVFIQKASLNGTPINQCWILWDSIISGGQLGLQLGPEPNLHWARSTPPPSASSRNP